MWEEPGSYLFWPEIPIMLTALCMQVRLTKEKKLWCSASDARQPQVKIPCLVSLHESCETFPAHCMFPAGGESFSDCR